jgi:hypothetical protein
VIQGTASEAVLVVLLAARDRTLRKHGKTSLDKLVVYASDQIHSALQKACQVCAPKKRKASQLCSEKPMGLLFCHRNGDDHR